MTNWPVKTLGEVCDLSTGGTPSTGNKAYYEGGQIKWLRSGDVHQREIHDCDGRITEEGMQNANTRYLPLNSVLIALAGQGKTRGTVAMLRTKATCNQSVVSIMPIDGKTLLPEFVFWNLHMKYDEIRRMTGDDGNDRRGLNMRLIRSMTVPIAPLEEQKRIVALLDAASARVTELSACYEQARTHANYLFASALRDSLESNPDWPVKSLGDVCELVSRGRPPSYCEVGGIVVLNQKCVRHGKVDFGPSRRTDDSAKVIPEWAYLREGDTLINSTGAGTLGRASFISKLTELTTFDTHLTVVRPLKDLCWPAFVGLVLNGREKDIVDLAGGATGQTELPRESVRSFEIPVPPLEEQKKIVAQLDSMRAKTSEMVAAYDAKLAAAKDLRQSILEAAFAGEL